VVARANHHVRYPARFQLIAAMNTCRCGGPADCRRGPRCAAAYQGRLSGPLLDRIDLQLDVPAVTPADLALPPAPEGTREAAARVVRAREVQAARARDLGLAADTLNAVLPAAALEAAARPDAAGAALLEQAAQTLRLSARGYHRTLKAARTIADLDESTHVHRVHIAEALSLRRQWANAAVSVS
jgi:magnesium chelatase family protein